MKTFIIKCTVCGTETGRIELPASSSIDVKTATLADFHIEDSLCDEHNHG